MCDKETSKTKELKEKLLLSTKSGIKKLSADEIAKADSWCEDYKIFLDNSKTERDAVEYSIELLKKNGFVEFECGKKYNAGDKVYLNNRGKALIAAVMGKKGVSEGTRLAIAHIDSPRIDLKPNPLYEASDLALFKTHYYGGIRKYQWLAMPLALHGVVALVDGTTVKVNFGEDEKEPVLCISDLLPHLAYEQVVKPLNKAFDGEDLNVLVGSRPFSDEDEGELVKLNVMNILNQKYGITENDFLSAELCLVPTYKTRDVGFDRSMLGGYGHDDKCCAYPAIMAAIDAKEPEYTHLQHIVQGTVGAGADADLVDLHLSDFGDRLDVVRRVRACRHRNEFGQVDGDRFVVFRVGIGGHGNEHFFSALGFEEFERHIVGREN